MYNFDTKKLKKSIDNTIFWIRVDKRKVVFYQKVIQDLKQKMN